jgi:predicted XRE-type DNA-binding protein
VHIISTIYGLGEELCAQETMLRAEVLKEKLRKAIAAKIKREGLSQSEAGRLCDTSRIHMNHLVKGTGPIALSRLIEVAEDLGLKVDLIIEDSRQEK